MSAHHSAPHLRLVASGDPAGHNPALALNRRNRTVPNPDIMALQAVARALAIEVAALDSRPFHAALQRIFERAVDELRTAPAATGLDPVAVLAATGQAEISLRNLFAADLQWDDETGPGDPPPYKWGQE
jgi:hypothetical protein